MASVWASVGDSPAASSNSAREASSAVASALSRGKVRRPHRTTEQARMIVPASVRKRRTRLPTRRAIERIAGRL